VCSLIGFHLYYSGISHFGLRTIWKCTPSGLAWEGLENAAVAAFLPVGFWGFEEIRAAGPASIAPGMRWAEYNFAGPTKSISGFAPLGQPVALRSL
jgi:hypothetical protein